MPSNVLDFRGRIINLAIQDPIERIPQMKSFHLLRTLISTSVVVLCFAALVSAQETTGTINGTVTDPNGAVVAGATVTLTDAEKKIVVRTVTTNDDGIYTLPDLPVATYDIAV